ncbi:hypothetical protein [Glycomyces paridis]|uniref:Exo-alpha-sialidase n=1 Tax=Glycomyces paridis TaxID=2126555 RepID=A0A4S8PJ94_9ACTN|nr:hypothetical protein [Glycomyces paridis]THV30071.1 hypothetical protein E9998_06755 [Glycomyces paridis]
MAVSPSADRVPGLTRRTVLTGAAALLAAGAADALAPLPASAAAAPLILAAAAGWTGRDGELLVLTADPETESDHAVRILAEPADAEAPAVPGPPLPLPMPADFHPHSMAALGPVLWITGAVELAADRSRPALIRIENGTAVETPLPVPDAIKSGIATAVTPLGTDGLAVAIEGCPDEHLSVITRSHLALSLDRGETWTEQALATGLGEGYGTVLAETDQGLFAAVADTSGTQTLHTGVLDAAALRLETVATLPESGRAMAAVACDEHVSVFSEQDGTAVEARFTHDGAPLEAATRPEQDCGCDGEILAVPGRRGLWLETDGASVHIRGAR